MTLSLENGVAVEVQRLDAVVHDLAHIEAEGLVVPAAPLLDSGILSGLARKLRGSKCAVVAILGAEAERVHDELDELLVGDGTDVESLPTTTWHDDEDAEDVLRMVAQMVVSSGSRRGLHTIWVITMSTTTPADLPGLLRLLAAELHGHPGDPSSPANNTT